MIRLPLALAAWGSPEFAAVLVAELRALGPQALPLHRLATTGHALEERLALTLLAVEEGGDALRLTLGVFFDEILPGCSCGDEAEPQPAYGELTIRLDRLTADARICSQGP